MESGIDLQSSKEVMDQVISKDDADKRGPEISKAGVMGLTPSVCTQIRKSLQDSMRRKALHLVCEISSIGCHEMQVYSCT